MSAGKRRSILLTLTLATLWISLLGYATNVSWADSFDERRALVGLKLFRTLVFADLDISQKISDDGKLRLAVVYADDPIQASEYRRRLQASFADISDTSAVVDTIAISSLLQNTTTPPAAIFLGQQLKESERSALARYSVTQRIIVFSPYEGDVEAGILAGISVQATVSPLVNMKTLAQGDFRIKPFYLQVARHYE